MSCDHLNDWIRAILDTAETYMDLPEVKGDCPWCEIERLRQVIRDEVE